MAEREVETPERRWTLSAESVTAASAVVAALIALAVGVWENVQQRRHARMSVFPSIEYVAELRTEETDSSARGAIRIVNEGVGPAIIDDVRVRVRRLDGSEQVYRTWAEAEEVLGTLGVEITRRAEFGEGSVMGAGRERDLVVFEFEAAERPQQAAERFARVLDRLGVEIVYRSIYGDEYRATLESR